MKAARAGLEAAREYMSGEEWKKAQAELDRAQKELSSARKLSAAQLAAVREQEEAVRKYMASDEWKEAARSRFSRRRSIWPTPGYRRPWRKLPRPGRR